MPGTGKHRRPKSSPIARGFVAAGTGGAALALPLLGATGANAAELPAAQVPAALQAQSAARVAVQAQIQSLAMPAAPKAVQQVPSVYTVVSGDCLSDIAQDRQLGGGWEQLYADNREAVGSDPSLIHPGLKLTVGAPGQGAAEAPAGSEQPAEAPAAQEQPAEAAPAPEQPAEAAPEQQAAPEQAAPAPAPEQESAPAANSAADAKSSGAATAGGFVAPVIARVNTPYGASGAMWSSGTHTGVDFAARAGTSVKAVGAGTVVSAGWAGSYGNEVIIKHADGHYSQYGHMSQLSVSVGQSVTAGAQVGLVGSTGNSTGPHLHFEIRTGQNYGSDINPLNYLRSKGVSV
ncbi:peptidase [Streptomyces venezuelae]|uniref:Peptidase n=1 Tax=Streptomyces venezuelae TaxID=54571 RepID=A0A5P2CYD6_STRVZ|nr:M23 family metallopeptidase [Streptomyces venezuelae]QES47290.1 peptidase [Streptomyces venezuelae]